MGLFKSMFGRNEMVTGERRSSLLSASEGDFMNILLKIMDAESFIVCPKVNLGSMISVRDQKKSKFSVEHTVIDFMLCERDSFRPVLGIELDDSTNNRPEMAEQDLLINKLFEHAELPLLRINVQREYDVDDIAHQVFNALGIGKNDVVMVEETI